MEVGSICQREVDTIQRTETVQGAANRMLQRNVGSLVVVDEDDRPIGMLTDRDLALRVIPQGLPPTTTVQKVMSPNPQCVKEGYVLEAALNRMGRVPCRRLPVIDDDGVLIGIVSLDDIHQYHAEQGILMGAVLRRETPENLAEA